jgi:hypothetical protein
VLVLGLLVGLAGYYALLTHLAFATQARRLLAVHFTAIPARPGEAVAIWTHNSRLVLGVAVCVALTVIVRALTEGLRKGSERLWASDGLLALWALGTTVTAGVLLGAYGSAQAHAFWPYAPVETLAWAILLALYINARRGPIGWRQAIWSIVGVELLLALAATLETFGGSL